MSIEFYALRESRNGSNVREVESAFVDKVALVRNPEFQQTEAEVRGKQKRVKFWL